MSENTEKDTYTTEYNDFPQDPAQRPYHKVYLPEGELPKEQWDVNQRRAYLLQEIKKRGLPDSLPVCELADKFDVSRRTIWKDKNVLREWMSEHLSVNHEAEAYATFTHAREQLLEEGEYYKAAKIQGELSEWLEDRGEIEQEPDKVQVQGGDGEGGLSIDFNVVGMDGEDAEDAE